MIKKEKKKKQLIKEKSQKDTERVKGRGTKCLKNQPCDVIKMREIRGKVRKKTHKKRDG